MRRNAAAAVLAALLAAPVWAGSGGEFDPATGYRISRYQAPVPDEVPGGRRVGFDEVERLVREKSAILIDVLPTDGEGADPETGAWSLRHPHRSIPGAVWLPDVGRGRLDAGLEHYFAAELQRLTGGDKARPLVIFCQSDCWMGWNAAMRAARLGYLSVLWYAEGSDGWRDWDGNLNEAVPVPMQPSDARSRREPMSAPPD